MYTETCKLCLFKIEPGDCEEVIDVSRLQKIVDDLFHGMISISSDEVLLICRVCREKLENFYDYFLFVLENHGNCQKEEGYIFVEDPDQEEKYVTDCSSKKLKSNSQTKEELKYELLEVLEDVDVENIPMDAAAISAIESEDDTIQEIKIEEKSAGSRQNNSKIPKKKIRSPSKKENTPMNKNNSHFIPNIDTKPDIKPEQEEADDELIQKYFNLTCDQCKKAPKIKGYREFKKHMYVKHGAKQTFYCCGLEFISRQTVLRHCMEHENPINCPQCQTVCESRVKYVKHMQQEHNTAVSLRVKKRNKEICVCNECGKSYKGKEKIKTHLFQVHFKRTMHICDICAISYKTAVSLKDHMNREHFGVKLPRAQCPHCGKWVQQRCLSSHVKNHLEGPVAAHCPICSQFFKNKRNMQRHVRERHSDDRNRYQCTYCPKGFFQEKKLKEHVATHTGIPLYTCEWCSAVFKSSGNIAAHKRKLHPAEYAQQKFENRQKREQPD